MIDLKKYKIENAKPKKNVQNILLGYSTKLLNHFDNKIKIEVTTIESDLDNNKINHYFDINGKTIFIVYEYYNSNYSTYEITSGIAIDFKLPYEKSTQAEKITEDKLEDVLDSIFNHDKLIDYILKEYRRNLILSH